jgi:hypothetical protein
LADIEALKRARLLQNEILNRKDDSLPEDIVNHKGADILYRNLKESFSHYHVNDSQFSEIILEMLQTIKQKCIVDWHLNSEQIRIMTNAIDDYLYDIVKVKKSIDVNGEDRMHIIKTAIDLARSNHDLFKS